MKTYILMKHSYEEVNEYYKQMGCILLDTEYVNSHTKMHFICGCGNTGFNSLDKFKYSNRRCLSCSGRIYWNYSMVKEYFESVGCILLSTEYKTANHLLKYICNCERRSQITLANFQNGVRCIHCGHTKLLQNGHVYKDYTFPSGETRKIQGYENIALDELLKTYNEEDIFTDRKDIHVFKYCVNGSEYNYYPDIYIPSTNTIIEVKSDWTYKKNLIKNIHKSLVVRSSGFNFEFWIYDRKLAKTIL